MIRLIAKDLLPVLSGLDYQISYCNTGVSRIGANKHPIYPVKHQIKRLLNKARMLCKGVGLMETDGRILSIQNRLDGIRLFPALTYKVLEVELEGVRESFLRELAPKWFLYLSPQASLFFE